MNLSRINSDKLRDFIISYSELPADVVVAEYSFAKSRKFRADVAIPLWRIIAEVDGGIYTGGRHTTASGHITDSDKMCCAAERGWSFWRCHADINAIIALAVRIVSYMKVSSRKAIDAYKTAEKTKDFDMLDWMTKTSREADMRPLARIFDAERHDVLSVMIHKWNKPKS